MISLSVAKRSQEQPRTQSCRDEMILARSYVMFLFPCHGKYVMYMYTSYEFKRYSMQSISSWLAKRSQEQPCTQSCRDEMILTRSIVIHHDVYPCKQLVYMCISSTTQAHTPRNRRSGRAIMISNICIHVNMLYMYQIGVTNLGY